MELVAAIVLALGLCWMLGRDDARLWRRARRYRELRFEGELKVAGEYARSLRSRKGTECLL